MVQFEIKKKGFYPAAIFYEDKLIIKKKINEIIIPTEEIDYIEYAKPTLLNYIWAIHCWFGGIRPGQLQIHLKKKIGKTRLYIIKIKYDELWKLPKFYRVKIGYSSVWEE